MNFAATGCTLLMTTWACAQLDSGGGKVAVGILKAIADRGVIRSFKTVSYSGATMRASWDDIQLATT